MKLLTILKATALCTSVFTAGILCAQPDYQENTNLLIADNTHSDTGITTDVKAKFMKEKLFGSADVSAMSIKVETTNGTVHLTGTADNQEQINNAVALTKSVDGVTNVVNDVTIKQ